MRRTKEERSKVPKCKSFSEWIVNFFYYYKWWMLFAALMLIVAAVCIHSYFDRESYDYKVSVLTGEKYKMEHLNAVSASLKWYAEDLDGNGEVQFAYTTLSIDSNATDPNGYMADVYLVSEDITNAYSRLYFIDSDAYEIYTERYPSLFPEGTLEESGVKITETKIWDVLENEGFSDDIYLILATHADDEAQRAAKQLLNNIVDKDADKDAAADSDIQSGEGGETVSSDIADGDYVSSEADVSSGTAAPNNTPSRDEDGYPYEYLPVINAKGAGAESSYVEKSGSGYVVSYISAESPEIICDKYTQLVTHGEYTPNKFDRDDGGYMLGGKLDDWTYTVNLYKEQSGGTKVEILVTPRDN